MAAGTPLKVAIVMSTYTQRDLAEAVGLSETYLSRIVSGVHVPSYETKVRIARKLQRPGTELGWPEIDEPIIDVPVAA